MRAQTMVDRGDLVESVTRTLADYRRLKQVGFVNREGTFFPAGVHYPPITDYPDATQEELFAGYEPPADRTFDVYSHIPFCAQRCVFCHYPVKLGYRQDVEKELYLAALAREMDLAMRQLGLDRIRVRSVLVGGGTPTFLTPRQLERYLDDLTSRLDLSRCSQFNFDVDPVTLLGPTGAERMAIMRDHGVDRLTIGVQSLDEATLARMNRHHGAKEALEAIAAARRMGYRLNIEFIFGFPGQTLESWSADIAHARTLDVDEIQMYRLKIDAYGDYQGPIKALLERGDATAPHDEIDIAMKRVAIDLLRGAGFVEPIRRVFARQRHLVSQYAFNQCCMLHEELGFGLTAFSSLRDRFVLNTPSFERYYAAIAEGRLPLDRGLVRDLEAQKRWAFILPLKNSFVRRAIFERRAGIPVERAFPARVDLLERFGLLERTEWGIRSTPRGAFYADELSHQFYSPEYLPLPRDAYADGPLNPWRELDEGGRTAALPEADAFPREPPDRIRSGRTCDAAGS